MNELAMFLALALNPHDELAIKREFGELYRRDQLKALHIPCILPTTKISKLAISSLYGYRTHPKWGGTRHHDGIDISVKNADVVATASGIVKRAGFSQGYGNFVEIDHRNGYSTLYGHLSVIFVEVGQKVDILSLIGRSGATGVVTGEHIHYEVKRNNINLNPLYFILLFYDNLSRPN
ncbi:M23 family metallopeptidase [Dyadobacter alkalitolerans]|uniref:M23 family metallopeptidase n=1 Tax=Dyadobacter alkalitolerans TaxID=492736 RepID=UPI0006879A07|nr:M23 family metallopeptidase [Dyadobacter alkalitolerans]